MFCLHKFPHAVTEVRACGTESPTIVGEARYAFAELTNHMYVPDMYVCMYERMYERMYLSIYVCEYIWEGRKCFI